MLHEFRMALVRFIEPCPGLNQHRADRPVDLLGAAAEIGRLRVHVAGVQAGQGHDDLEDRARRIKAADRPVLEREVRVADEAHPLLGGEPVDELVRVEVRIAGQGEDVPGLRVQDDDGPFLALEDLLGLPLEVEIQGQAQAPAPFRAPPASPPRGSCRGCRRPRAGVRPLRGGSPRIVFRCPSCLSCPPSARSRPDSDRISSAEISWR